MNADIALGIVGGLMHVVAFLIYNWQMLRGASRPNAATWTLWVVLSTLNCVTYLVMTGDWVKGLLPIVSTLFCALVFVVSLIKGKLSELSRWDTAALVVGVIAIAVWLIFHSAVYANIILQVCIMISFIPTVRGVWHNPAIEKALPWFIWSLAYITSVIVVYLRWQGHLLDLVYPFNGMVLHGIVGVLAVRGAESK